ncbi:M14 family metallopeptidase [Youxingia wuxianensis]|uniref:Gamma-D-glutamyl-meso-diaminopimelate peptidase n=1 Tax=Youxingia wuxianensis TaxID=2763678 RepID=A0A926IJ38_9FIRM|nr:M14 family metallocarboxypeptidase [Youxingia wuxianensis]MBC8586303.1 gamma-D-glutamyl-meso-diaminopimelate peptidase [Youxingia wuxianensis]
MFDEFYKTPACYENIHKAVVQLKGTYPLLKAFPIGKSVLGRSIFALGLGDIHKGTLFVGGVHGMEWLTTLLLFRFMEDVLKSVYSRTPLADIDIGRALENRSLVVIPCLNPDGVEIQINGPKSAKHLESYVEKISGGDTSRWQANARGIDLNHNFDAGFRELKKMEEAAGIFTPGPTRYGGKFPHSEPESKALVNFCLAFHIRQAYAFHSQGEEIYYRYGSGTPARSQLMAQVMASASGYKLCQPEAIASHGGFKDWFIDKLHRPGFTIEIGRGVNPLPIEELEPIYARLLEMMLICVLL